MSIINASNDESFQLILDMIQESRAKASRAVNHELIDLYWKIGKYISDKCSVSGWGSSIVVNLSDFIHKAEPKSRGFSSQNLWRMKQFFESYRENKKLSLMVREINWTNNMLIVGHAKSDEEKEFYLQMTIREKYSKSELLRQLDSSLFERTMLSTENISPIAREIYHGIKNHIRDFYSFEFLSLGDNFSESSFQKAILKNLKQFILEFGKDFLFIEEEYRIQVGNTDYFIDLLFYHRGLNCLVAVDLKVGEFKPEFMGKMDFLSWGIGQICKKRA